MDYIPKTDSGALSWLQNIATVLATAYATYGVTLAESNTLTGLAGDYDTALTTATDPSTRNETTVAAKDAAKAEAVAYARPLAQRIAVNATLTPAQKLAVGVNTRTATPTPTPAPAIAPGLGIVSAIPGLVIFEHSNPETGKRAKPDGVTSIEVAAVVGTAFTADPSAAVSRGDYTKGLIRVAFAPGESGQKVSMFARYKTRSGPGGVSQVGPWSAPTQFVAM